MGFGPLRPNSRGIITTSPQTIKTGSQTTPYYRPTRALERVDRLLQGEIPRIYVSRKQGGLGDVLMITPTVKALSKKYNTKIIFGTDFEYLDGALPLVFRGNPFVERVVPFRDLDPEDYDVVIDLTCPCVAYEIPKASPINRIDLFARHVGITLSDMNMDYFISDDEKKWAQDYLARENLTRYRLVLVQAFSTTTARDFPPEKLQKAINSLVASQKDVRVILLTHDSDSLKPSWNVPGVHRLHNFKMRQIAAIMNECKLIICPDSAILHLASALHLPTVTLFAPTDPRARINYHPEAVAIWPAKHLQGFPTWYAATNNGGIGWKLIETDLIRDVSLSLLNKTPLPTSKDLVYFGEYTQLQEQPYCLKV